MQLQARHLWKGYLEKSIYANIPKLCETQPEHANPLGDLVGIDLAYRLMAASSIPAGSVKGSHKCISDDRNALSMWFGTQVNL